MLQHESNEKWHFGLLLVMDLKLRLSLMHGCSAKRMLVKLGSYFVYGWSGNRRLSVIDLIIMTWML